MYQVFQYTIAAVTRLVDKDAHDQFRALARGANVIVADPLNRKLNGTRSDLRPTSDEASETLSATATLVGDGAPPEEYVGTLGGRGW